MKTSVAFFRAVLRMSLRNRQAFFWNLFFPTLFMIGVALFGESGAPSGMAAGHDHAAPGSASPTYLDFAIPGLLSIVMMNSSLFSTAMLLTAWRDRGILKRLRLTSLSPVSLWGSVIGNQLITGTLSLAIFLTLAVTVFGARGHLAVLPIAMLGALGFGVFFSLGFFISGLARSTESVPPLVNLISLPMMLLSGVFFPVERLPDGLEQAVQVFPLTCLVDGLRLVMHEAAPWSALQGELAGLSAWTLALLLGIRRAFRWQ